MQARRREGCSEAVSVFGEEAIGPEQLLAARRERREWVVEFTPAAGKGGVGMSGGEPLAPGPGGAAERARPRDSRGRGATAHVAGGAGLAGGRDCAMRLSTAASSCLPDPVPFPFPAVHFPPRPRLPSASPPFLLCFTT